MSRETMEWLNTNTMIGHTIDKDRWAKSSWVTMVDGVAKAWWQQDGFQNGYEGAIPVEEVERVLFNWEPVQSTPFLRLPVAADDDNYDGIDGADQKFIWVPDTDHQGVMHPVTHQVFRYFGADSWQLHGYKPWLIDNVAAIADGEVGIDSAGLLRGGGVAYVTLSLPEGVTTSAGLEFRPTILAATSIDGTKKTIYSSVKFIPICDNSMEAAESDALASFKIKHSSKSLGRLSDARSALGLIYQNGEQFGKFLDALTEVDVTDAQFRQIIEGLAPFPTPEIKDGKLQNQRALTIAERKHNELLDLWQRDQRAAKWNGTLLGAYQAANTWNEHFKSNNDNQVERIMTGVVSGTFNKMDREFWDIVASVQGIDTRALVAVGK